MYSYLETVYSNLNSTMFFFVGVAFSVCFCMQSATGISTYETRIDAIILKVEKFSKCNPEETG